MYGEFMLPECSQTAQAWIEETLKPPTADRVQWQSSPTSSAALNKLRRNMTVPTIESA